MPNPQNIKPGVGGKRPGAGRKPDWFKKKCQKIATSDKVLKFLQSVVEGEPIEAKQKVLRNGEVKTVWESASVESRVKAWTALMDRGFGKPEQPVEHSGEVKSQVIVVRDRSWENEDK